jgi:hypothetical protein
MSKSSVRLAAAGEPPDQKRVDGAEENLAGEAPLAQARNRFQQVHDLGRGEIRIEDQAGPPPHDVLEAAGLEPRTDRRRHAALPDDRRRHRAARRAIPEDRRLPLVGDADGGHLLRTESRLRQHAAAAGDLRPPDVLRVVLHDAEVGGRLPVGPGGGERPRVLRKLLLGDGQRHAPTVEEDRPTGGRPLVEREHAGFFHSIPPVHAHQFMRIGSYAPVQAAAVTPAAPRRPPESPGRTVPAAA